jgi:hypothetical protein
LIRIIVIVANFIIQADGIVAQDNL